MPLYEVTIRAIITKCYQVAADSPDDAQAEAEEIFDYRGVDAMESYDQETTYIREIHPTS